VTEREMLEVALKRLRLRGVRVAPRISYFEGRHPFPPGSDAWTKQWRDRLGRLIDNQCALVVETRADAVMPAHVEPVQEDKLAAAAAAWVTDLLDREAATLTRAFRQAEAAGEQVTLAIDWNSEGQIDIFHLDTRSCYVHRDAGGAYLWAVHLWREEREGAPTEATLYLPTETVHYRSSSTAQLPDATDFAEVTRTPNPFGELMLATIDKGGSLIDRIAPHQDALNQSMQTEFVVGEHYAHPFRAWLGFDSYDPATGEVSTVVPTVNAATGGRDLSVPTVADAEGERREVIQFESPDPDKYLRRAEAERAAIARLGYVPAFLLQVTGTPPASGEALEIAYRPHIERAAADWRAHYRPAMQRLVRLAARRWLHAATGRPVQAPDLNVVPVNIETSTAASRAVALSQAVAAGVPLEDALVAFFRMDREAARLIAERADEQAQARADRALALAEQGYLGA
jgi:hypothetical protein